MLFYLKNTYDFIPRYTVRKYLTVILIKKMIKKKMSNINFAYTPAVSKFQFLIELFTQSNFRMANEA